MNAGRRPVEPPPRTPSAERGPARRNDAAREAQGNWKGSMDSTIAAVLTLDGIGNGAEYALLGIAIVLVFAVTRVILIPQGEFVAYSALTLATLQLGRVPGTVWLALLLAALTVLREAWDGLRTKRAWPATGVEIARLCALPVAAATVTYVASGHQWP